MKLAELDLIAFGPFTDLALDLSAGHEGLHLIYGPNEAGKSAALRAITQLLFGIPTQSPDAFVHPYNQMRIGGTLRDGQGATLRLIRRKGRQKTLRDQSDEGLVDESEFRRFLGGVTQETFRHMFGIDHAELVAGGKSILQGSGDLGQTLFAAAAGLADCRAVQDQLEREAKALFVPRRASKPDLNAALGQLAETRKTVRKLALPTEEWVKHDATLAQARHQRDDIERMLQQKLGEKNRLQRICKAVPLITRRRQVLAALDPVADAVLLPDDFANRRRETQQELRQAEQAAEDAEQAAVQINHDNEALDVNEGLLAQADLIEDLKAQVSIHHKALGDRDLKLKPELEQFKGQANAILNDLRPGWELDQVEALRLTSAQRRRIQDLRGRSESLRTKAEGASQTYEDLQQKRRALQAQRDRRQNLRDPAELDRAIQRAQRCGDIDDQIRQARLELEHMEQQAAIDLAGLGLWNGNLDELQGLPVPPHETIERFDADLDQAARRVEELHQRIAELTEERRDADGHIERLKRERDVPTEPALADARKRRDDGWKLARTAWEEGRPPHEADSDEVRAFMGTEHPPSDNLADAYEAAVRTADDLGDRLRREADRVASLAQLEAEAGSCVSRLAELAEELDGAQASLGALSAEWQAVWDEMAIQTRPPREMADWTRQRDDLVKQAQALRARRTALAELTERAKEHFADIGRCLEHLGEVPGAEDESFVALVERAQKLLEKHTEAIQERDQLARDLAELERTELPQARRAAEVAEADLAHWTDKWAEAAAVLGLPGDATPHEVNAVLDQTADLFAKLEAAEAHRTRIEDINRDYEAFAERVQQLAANVAPELSRRPADQAVQVLYEQLKRAREASATRRELQKQLRKEEKRLKDAQSIIQRTGREFEAMCREARVDRVDDLPEAEQRSTERRTFEEKRDPLNEELLRLSSGQTLGEFMTEAVQENPDTLEPRIARLAEETDELRAQDRALSEEIGRERECLEQMDGRGDAAQAEAEAQSLVARIATQAEQYARLRIAAAILRRAVERFRDKNQAPMLERAGAFFATLTRGSFEGLRADYDDKGNSIIVGVRPGGTTTLPLEAMSDGSADQLYVALRLAGLTLYLERTEPVPFIVDDILLNFDDDRAVAALGALARLSQQTQVIFFTHHNHLVELARGHLDENVLFVHELPGGQEIRTGPDPE